MIIVDEKTIALWRFRIDEKTDWLGVLREETPDQKYKFEYRFRYYKDDEVFEASKDTKHWYSMVCSGTRNFVLKSLRLVVSDIVTARSQFPGSLSEFVNDDGDYQTFMRKIMDAPGMYARSTSTPKEGK
jgi:hypothetical protein